MKSIMSDLHIDLNKSKDTGLAMVLILLIIGLVAENELYFQIAIGAVVILMVYPQLFKPLAYIWFGLSLLLGTFLSKIILTVIFFGLVTPLGIIKRMFGSEPLQLKKWNSNVNSAFKTREHVFIKDDITHPF